MALAVAICMPAAQAAQEPIALQGVTIVGAGGAELLHDQVIVLRDGTIEGIASAGSVEIAEDILELDLSGRYVVPGLIDFHVHLRHTSELVSYLRYGVTTIVQLSGGLGDAPTPLRYRDLLAAGDLVGPTLYTSGPILDGDPPLNPGVSTAVRGSEDGRAAVRAQAEAGYDFIKVYNRLPNDALRAIVTQAHELGMLVTGHVPRPEDRASALRSALDTGLDIIVHGEEFFFSHFYTDVDEVLDRGDIPWRETDDVPVVTRWVLDAGAAVVPNLSFVAATRTQLDSLESLWSHPEFQHLEPAVQDFWRTGHFGEVVGDVDRFSRRELAKERFLDQLTLAFSRAGVPLLLGTDASYVGLFPGLSAHLELQELVEAGLTPFEALTAGTRTPGEILFRSGVASQPLGVIEPGARADLVVLTRDPSSSASAMESIEGVVSRGRWYTVQELERLRQASR